MHLPVFYQSALSACDDRIRVLRRKSNILALVRLLLFVGLVYSIYWLTRHFSSALLILPVGVAALFIACVNFHFRLKDERILWEKLRFVDANELGILEGKANEFPDGLAFLDPDNYLDDLDIFGKSSLFHALNRTTTSHGTAAFATLLRQSFLSPADILQQQSAIKQLALQSQLRRLLTAKGLVAGEKEGNLDSLNDWLNIAPRLYPRKGLRIGIAVLTLFNLWTIYFLLDTGNYLPLIAGIIVCRALTGYFSKYIGQQHDGISRKQVVLEQYADILAVFSTVESAGSPLLEQLKARAASAYKAIRQLSRLSSYFDNRMNLLVNTFLNSLVYYDLQCMVALERWKSWYKKEVPLWIQAVGEIECLNSLATFAFNNPDHIYPLPVNSEKTLFIETTELAHPLIPASRRIANDFTIGRNERLILVTGSNMSGKTTFLRTIGVNLLLAQCGAPVCAASFTFTPMQLLTSLRISDSLQEQTSYFMAELKKLQKIVHRLQTGVPALVLIDEILRGTNSEDKTYGSEQFTRKLIGYGCLSLFATHDLSLGRLEEELPGVISNYCFESVIEAGDLHFNYRLQRGIARNRNASFLMKKMDII
jgi:MutS domain V